MKPLPLISVQIKKKKKKRQNCANLFPLPIEALVLSVMQNNKKFTWKLSIERKPTKSHVSLLHSSASFRDSHNVSKMRRVRAENIYQPAILSSFSIPRLTAMHLMMIAKKYSTVNNHTLPSSPHVQVLHVDLGLCSPCCQSWFYFWGMKYTFDMHTPSYKQWLYCTAVSQLISSCFFLDY